MRVSKCRYKKNNQPKCIRYSQLKKDKRTIFVMCLTILCFLLLLLLPFDCDLCMQTALDINPLLPFVRTSANAMPFNSVDLSLSSTSTSNANNRNSLTPSPRNQVSPGSGPLQNRFTKSSTDGGNDDSSNNGANKMDNNKLNTDPIAFLNEMSEQLASMRSNRNMTPSTTLPARDSNNLTSDLSNFRNNAGNDKVQSNFTSFSYSKSICCC